MKVLTNAEEEPEKIVATKMVKTRIRIATIMGAGTLWAFGGTLGTAATEEAHIHQEQSSTKLSR